MKLLTPVNSIDSTIKQIDAGANEIYLAGDTDFFNTFSFSGRGRFTADNNRICPDFHEINDIVQYAHQRNVTVMFCANIPFFADDPDDSQYFLGKFYEYVEKALFLGVDSIIVGDLGAILYLRERGIKAHITASTFFETVNRDQILFLKEIGANRVVLSYQVVLSEIEELAGYKDLELEVFGHYGCSFYDDCNMKHNFGESVDDNIGIPCRNFYRLIQGENIINQAQYLNSSLLCSICSLPRLKKVGIYALKLVGRDYQTNENVRITSIYSKVLNYLENYTDNIELIKQKILPEWWINSLCNKGLCKYLNNKVTRAFIGL